MTHVGTIYFPRKYILDGFVICIKPPPLRWRSTHAHANQGVAILRLRTKTFLVIPTGANGNIGNTGPGLRWKCGGGCQSDRSGPFWVAGLGELRRFAGTSSRYLYNICSLGMYRTPPRPARGALLPRHPLHPPKRSAWECCGACARQSTLGLSPLVSLPLCPAPLSYPSPTPPTPPLCLVTTVATHTCPPLPTLSQAFSFRNCLTFSKVLTDISSD